MTPDPHASHTTGPEHNPRLGHDLLTLVLVAFVFACIGVGLGALVSP